MRLLAPLAAILLLSACSGSGPLHKPAELQPLAAERSVVQHWLGATPASRLDRAYDRLRPVVAQGAVYGVGARGVVEAFDAGRGKRLWRRDLDTPLSAALGHNETLLFAGSADGELIALRREDGEVAWRAPLASEAVAVPGASRSHVVAVSGDGTVQAFSADSGVELWRARQSVPALSLRGASTPVIAGDLVLVGTADGRLQALSIHTGEAIWEAVVAVPSGRTDLERMVDVDATPRVADGVVYAAAYQGRVVALALDSGRLLWSRDIGSWAGMALDGENLYVVDDDSRVWALSRRNGATLWRQEGLLHRSITPPAIAGDALVVGDFQGYLHWLSLEDGAFLARYRIGGEEAEPLRVAPRVADGRLYARDVKGRIAALGTVDEAALAARRANDIRHRWW